jgi:signal transduction histidine kinase
MIHPPLTILLIEDDDAYAGLLRVQLEPGPPAMSLRHVRSLHQAEHALASPPAPDAVLLDLGLPDNHGLAAVHRIHALAPDLPIVVLTANDDESLAIEAVQVGAQDYLVKSTSDGTLVRRAIRYARERAALQRELRASEDELRHAHKMEAVGRLAGGVAHDFNNVLTAIFGYADLLMDQFGKDDPRRADLEEIRRSAERAATLTRQLLAFSRKQVMQPRLLSLNEVVTNLQKLMQRLVSEHISVELELAEGLWPVFADPGQIEQVLMNLAANARDAMPEGGRLDVGTSNLPVTADMIASVPGVAPGDYAVLTVTDTGAGIPETVRQNIFEPFFTTKDAGKGTGLGLATVYGIVKQTGGGICVTSEEGKGTRFRIFLPRAPEELRTKNDARA